MGIATGFIADPDQFHAVINKNRKEPVKIDSRVFKLHTQGSRLLVFRDEAEDSVGNIIVPETVKMKNPPGAGWVLSVGAMVGAGTSPHPHGLQCEHPADLLYKRIIFGMYVGHEFLTGVAQGGYRTDFWMLTDRDIWMVDENDSNQFTSVGTQR